MKLLSASFYQNEDVVAMAKKLLGKTMVTEINGVVSSGMIVETEAYRGPDDRGCHAYGGRCTERTKTMFYTGGHAYVYICYGVHPMVNVVTGPEGFAHAVLIRAIQPLEGLEKMMDRRNINLNKPVLVNGPGKLTVALGINKEMDGQKFYEINSPLRLYEDNEIPLHDIISGPRVGMSKHVGECSHRPWRFYIKNNPWVSKPLVVDYRGKW
ncbi:MAG: DNA-3-methyladenine glycosylase [Saprospiraceae bacterium]|nr:DNA-3-methyladenine glycosylase [Saprospiraceae bacterium]